MSEQERVTLYRCPECRLVRESRSALNEAGCPGERGEPFIPALADPPEVSRSALGGCPCDGVEHPECGEPPDPPEDQEERCPNCETEDSTYDPFLGLCDHPFHDSPAQPDYGQGFADGVGEDLKLRAEIERLREALEMEKEISAGFHDDAEQLREALQDINGFFSGYLAHPERRPIDLYRVIRGWRSTHRAALGGEDD